MDNIKQHSQIVEADLSDNNEISNRVENQDEESHTSNSQNSSHDDRDIVLKVDNVSKKFCRNLRRSMLYGIQDLAKGMVGIKPDTTTLRNDEFWALKDINIELREGEILGIIGANGSGKSTLLRVLTGIFPPDKGKIWIDGTVGGIIALGAGMHPHMTGRENIYLNGALFGMSKEEIDSKIDDIIEFSEIGDFLNAPLSMYSSGMKVRLGFSIAVHCEPDILLVDEVLAVGDLSYRNKCMEKMKSLMYTTKAQIFISHNIEQVRQICDKVMVLDKGIVKYFGKTDRGILEYESLTLAAMKKEDYSFGRYIVLDEDLDYAKFINFGISNGSNMDVLKPMGKLVLDIDYEIYKRIEPVVVVVISRFGEKRALISNISDEFEDTYYNVGPGKFTVNICYENLPLRPGKYSVRFFLKEAKYNSVISEVKVRDPLIITSDQYFDRGDIICDPKWTMELNFR